ncbi:MAG: sigma-54-dependent Fis family transcriptional regulator [bacterium]
MLSNPDIYKRLIKLIGSLVETKDISELVKTFSQSLREIIPGFFMSNAIWNRYEDELKIFSDTDANTDLLTIQYKRIVHAESDKLMGSYEGSALFTNPVSMGGEFFFFEKRHMARDACGIFFMEFGDKESFENFSSISGEILPQFWSIVEEQYSSKKAGEESEILWRLENAQQKEEEFLNNIELNQLLENLLVLALRKSNANTGVILLVNENSPHGEIEPIAVKGKALSAIPEKISRDEKSIALQVLDKNKPYISDNVDRDPNYYPLFKNVKSSLVVPIQFQNRCIGMIAVESEHKKHFSEKDAVRLQNLAKTATMFIRRAQLYKETSRHGGEGIQIIGKSGKWKEVERRIEKASRTDATVILRGETGCGKELLAHAIHFNSPRKNKPLVSINCAAIPSELLESEMFGHVKGAFTGATSNKKGEFEKANGGTIFLDEIGDLPPLLQVKLLRTLQNGEVRPVGSDKKPVHVDVRVIAATSRNLEKMLEDGSFRLDIYYRLHVVPIHIPPLREYKEDIPYLVNNFIKAANKRYRTKIRGIDKKALAMLMQYNYPGNVRQLRNFVQQAVIMCNGDIITAEDFPTEIISHDQKSSESSFVSGGIKNTVLKEKNSETAVYSSYKVEKQRVLRDFTRDYFDSIMKETDGNIRKAAKRAGISRVSLYKIFDKFGIDKNRYK